jgi:hypothetical protein
MGQMSIVFYFTNRCAIPTAAGRVYNVQRTHVFNVASVKGSLGMSSAARRARHHLYLVHTAPVYIRRMRRECCGVKLVVSYTVCPAGRP